MTDSAQSGKPRLLDLFCGAGGAAMGYHRAGFEVVGVDIKPQPNYPFEFIQGDALELLDCWIATDHPTGPFDAIHASPPCQAFTAYRRRPNHVADSPDLIAATRDLLEKTDLLWVIENVPGAPLLDDPLLLCGSMFDLDVQRHRLFEFGQPYEFPLWGCRHKIWSPRFKTATNRRNPRLTIEVGSWDEPLKRQKRAMGVDWNVTLEELSEMVPPAYTEFIGKQLLIALGTMVAA